MSPIHVVRRRAVITPALTWAQTSPLAGVTYQTDFPYAGTGIGTDGTTLFHAATRSGAFASNDTDGAPPQFCMLVRSNGVWTARWYQTQVEPELGLSLRYAYFIVVPTTGKGAYVVGTSNPNWTDIGWTAVGGVGQVFYSVAAFYSADWTAATPSVTQISIFHVTQTTNTEFVQTLAYDAFLGSDNALYAKYSWQYSSPTNNYCRRVRISGTTVTHEAECINLRGSSANAARMFRDATGNIYMLAGSGGSTAKFVWQCDATGLPTATKTATTLSVGESATFYPLHAQSGSALASSVDMVYPISGDAGLQFLRINLGATPSIALQEQIVASGLDTNSAAGGNGWAVNKIRVAHDASGNVYAVAQAPSVTGSADQRNLRFYKRDSGTGTWSLMHTSMGGQEPNGLALGTGGEINLMQQPNAGGDFTGIPGIDRYGV